MLKSKNEVRSSIVNRWKIIHVPLFIGIFSILIVSVTSYYISKNLLLDQMKQDGINLAKLATRRINKEMRAMELINTLIEEKIRVAGREVLTYKGTSSNELLKKIASNTGVDEIYWYNASGVILFSTIDAYLGWTTSEGHPVENFRQSGLGEFIEEVRKDTESDNFNKYGYFRHDDGSFIQVGIRASKIDELTKLFSYQSIVERLAQEDNIDYALILDANLKTIADSDLEDIGAVYTDHLDYLQVIEGKVVSFNWFNPKIDSDSLEVAVPLYHKDKIIGVFAIGLSLKNVYSHIYFIFISSTIIAIFTVLLYLWNQNRNLIQPVLKLDKNIQMIDVEKNIGYRLPTPNRDTFLGLYYSINTILDKVNEYFAQIKEQEEQIEYAAYHDELTGLPNKKCFIENLEKEILNNQFGAVLLIDIDEFKEINDTLGHVYGDKILVTIAEKLSSIKTESMFISRFGGDEFLISILGKFDACQIENYAKNVISLLRNEVILGEDELHISCSIGITFYTPNNNNISEIMMNADMAMYTAKDQGKNKYVFFNDEMLEKLKVKTDVRNILRKATTDKDFKLLYQPQVCVNTGETIGFEALLRLKNNTISPAQFIPIAEKTGMIIEISRWLTEEVINQISEWKNKGFSLKPIAINFSVKQLDDSGYIEFLEDTLERKGVEAKYIEIEITESLFLEKKEKTLEFLNRLKAKGIRIALDDFGTGYSSLSYLTFLPVDKIKLDKSLSDKYLETKNTKILEGIISLARSLDLEVVAEGIEHIEQYTKLKDVKCNYIQGYLFSPPLEVSEAEKKYNHNYLEVM